METATILRRDGSDDYVHKRLRRAIEKRQLATLSQTGARCAGCAHCRPHPFSPEKLTCDLGSDFHGYEMTTSDDLCLRFKKKEPTP